ncbi:MAG: VWA domain-containing protein [Bryobacteraceae bacterium]
MPLVSSSPGRTRFGRTRSRRGIAIILTALMLAMIIPMVGLAIDAGVMFAIRAKMSAAVDAAAIASAQALARGQTIADQRNTATSRAEAYYWANFPASSFQTKDGTVEVVVDESQLRTRTVQVTASVKAPVYFMRYLGWGTASSTPVVRVSGTASRRDVNVMMVIDRSGSLANAGACDDLEVASMSFVDMFANQRDRIGMVTFGGSYRVDYAPTQNFKDSPTLASQIDKLYPGGCNGGTGSAQALWKAYEQLVAINEPGALNVILFFTDGIPNAITGDWPVKTQVTTDSPTGTSHCYDWEHSKRYYDTGWNPSTEKYRGWIYGDSDSGVRLGIRGIDASTMPVSDDPGVVTAPIGHSGTAVSSSDDCYFRSSTTSFYKDIPYVLDTDLYGNSVFGWKTVDTYTSGPYAGKAKINTVANVNNAAINAVDNAALRVRQKELNSGIQVVIYCIGLGGAGEAEHEALRRIANTKDSTAWDSSAPEGLYEYAPSSSQLNQAFNRIASEMLRISK